LYMGDRGLGVMRQEKARRGENQKKTKNYMVRDILRYSLRLFVLQGHGRRMREWLDDSKGGCNKSNRCFFQPAI